MQPPFEDVQSAFVRYGIEVKSWGDVPQGVDWLAHKQGKEPLPDGELCFFLYSSVCNLSGLAIYTPILKSIPLKSVTPTSVEQFSV